MFIVLFYVVSQFPYKLESNLAIILQGNVFKLILIHIMKVSFSYCTSLPNTDWISANG